MQQVVNVNVQMFSHVMLGKDGILDLAVAIVLVHKLLAILFSNGIKILVLVIV